MRKIIILILLLLNGCQSKTSMLATIIKQIEETQPVITYASKSDASDTILENAQTLLELLKEIDEKDKKDSILIDQPSHIIAYKQIDKQVKIEIYNIFEYDEENNPIADIYVIGIGIQKSLGYSYNYYTISQELHSKFIELVNE